MESGPVFGRAEVASLPQGPGFRTPGGGEEAPEAPDLSRGRQRSNAMLD